jgi:hypothetical protein
MLVQLEKEEKDRTPAAAKDTLLPPWNKNKEEVVTYEETSQDRLVCFPVLLLGVSSS